MKMREKLSCKNEEKELKMFHDDESMNHPIYFAILMKKREKNQKSLEDRHTSVD
jgi:hypothetical protein